MPDAWIRQWGDPALRSVAGPVAVVDRALREQLAGMRRTLLAADGAGLAATQVGILRRAFVFRSSVDAPVGALLNPVVVRTSSERAVFHEGCLSFNSVLVAVERPAAVTVEAFDLCGRTLRIDAEGLTASLLQHEIDHLDGVLTLDRACAVERRRAVSALLEPRRLAA